MLEYILDGGWIMFPLVVLSVVSLGIIIDRWRVLVKAREATDLVRRALNVRIVENDLSGAIDACQQSSSPLAAVALTGLNKYRQMLLKKRDPVEMESLVSKLMEDYTPQALAVLEKRFNLLMLVASVSPMLGMLGTVVGMIDSFDTISVKGALDPSAVGGGISTALLTTAAGLMVAVPALIAYNLFCRKVDDYTLGIEQMMGEVVTFISDRSS